MIKKEIKMKQSGKLSFIGGIIGISLGGTAWLLLLGIYLKSPSVIFLTIIWEIIAIVGSIRLYKINHSRKLAIFAMAILWIVVLNFALANILYDKIPDTIAEITTGKQSFSIVKLNLFFGILSFIGFSLLVKDITHNKKI
jgi:hypothetical protein